MGNWDKLRNFACVRWLLVTPTVKKTEKIDNISYLKTNTIFAQQVTFSFSSIGGDPYTGASFRKNIYRGNSNSYVRWRE